MPRQTLRAVALAITLTGALTATTFPGQGAAGAAAPVAATADTVPDDPSGGVADNPFLPQERNIGDCASSLPRPDCGSDARGGWQQATVFGVLMLGMAFIGWRIFRAVRRRDQAETRVPG